MTPIACCIANKTYETVNSIAFKFAEYLSVINLQSRLLGSKWASELKLTVACKRASMAYELYILLFDSSGV